MFAQHGHAHGARRTRTVGGVVSAIVALAAFMLGAVAAANAQQSADIIRGRVVGADSQPVANVLVTALSYVGGIEKQRRTDKDGRYTIIYPNGEGDYWLAFNAVGFVSRRIEIKRHSDEDVLVANATLSKSQELNAVQVTGNVRLTLSRNDNFQDVSQSDRSISTGFVVVAPEAKGDLVAQVAALPSVQLIPGVDGAPDRFSIFGLSGDQNNATLNGMSQGLTKLPREASTTLQLRTGYDVATGGATGATIAVNTNSGSNQIARPLSVLLIAPQTQVPGPLGTASRYGSISASGRMTGPWRWDRNFYNLSFQFDHRQQDLLTVAAGANDALAAAGVSRDSIPALLDALGNAHIPHGDGGADAHTTSNVGSLLGTFDWAPKAAASGHALTLTVNGGFQSRGPNALSLTSTPSSLLSSNAANAGLQVRHTNFFGAGTLTESVVSVAGSHLRTSPEFRAPGASVVLASALDDSTTVTRAINAGGSSTASAANTLSIGARNTLSRISTNNRHRTKLTSELTFSSSDNDASANTLGTFTYQSLGDLVANRPSSFTRTIGATRVSAHSLLAGLALGDSWRPSANLQVQYGVRAEANTFLSAPARNTLLAKELGVRNDHVPNGVYLSPRIGFSKTILDSYTFFRGADYDYTTDNSTLSGGIGLFQNTRSADLVSTAISETGLPGSALTVSCVGNATPAPDWASYLASDASIPAACADGTTATPLGSAVPIVTLFARNFVEPKSIRGSLRYYTERIPQHRTTFEVTLAYNLNQAGQRDINLRDVQQFSLIDEGSRPVYVVPAGIDPASGLASLSGSRISSQFGAVRELRSDLHSQSATFSLSDIRLNFGEPFGIMFGYAFTYQREQFTGFTSSAGDPFAIGTSRGTAPTHDLNTTLRLKLGDVGALALYGRLRSGTHFTPRVAGDINGDGNAYNDRAFVFGGASGGNGATSVVMNELLMRGSSAARRCLQDQRGTVAGRNSCTTPWSFGGSVLALGINPTKLGLPARMDLRLTLSNPFGALDMLLHGSANARGWGQTPAVDQTLLFVRGFDAAKERYIYDVNERFGASQGRMMLSQTPAVLTLEMRVDAAPGFAWQAFNQAIQRGRQRTGAKLNEAAIRALGAPGGTMAPISLAYFLRIADDLNLTQVQADSLARVVYRFNRLIDSVWAPAAKRAASLPDTYDQAIPLRDFNAARNAVFDYWIAVMPSVRHLLTRGQFQSMNVSVRDRLFNENFLERQRSQFTSFGIYSVP